MFTIQEVAEELNVTEFSIVCALLDEHVGPKVKAHTISGSGWNDNKMGVAERSLSVKFDIISVLRKEKEIEVTVDCGFPEFQMVRFPNRRTRCIRKRIAA